MEAPPGLSSTSNASARPEQYRPLSSLLDYRIRIQVKDGRTLEGIFECLDHLGNIVLCDCFEWRSDFGKSNVESEEVGGLRRESRERLRSVGRVVVPRSAYTKVEVEERLWKDVGGVGGNERDGGEGLIGGRNEDGREAKKLKEDSGMGKTVNVGEKGRDVVAGVEKMKL